MYEGNHKNTVSGFKGVSVIGNTLFNDLVPHVSIDTNQNTTWTGCRVRFLSPGPHFQWKLT